MPQAGIPDFLFSTKAICSNVVLAMVPKAVANSMNRMRSPMSMNGNNRKASAMKGKAT